MKISIDKRQLVFYAWTTAAYLFIWFFSDLVNYPDTFIQRVFNNVWRVGYVATLIFFVLEYGLPKAMQRRKYFIYNLFLLFFLFCGYMMLCSVGLYIWRQLGISLHIYTSIIGYPTISSALSAQATYGAMSLLFFAVVRHFYNYLKLHQVTQQLRIEKQEAELNYLKSQTNPHFLFNTLNNIYALSREKSDLAPEAILRLSKILRFMLYETGGEYISVEQELKILDDYIELEKLRYDESLRIAFRHDVENMKQALPPLLLMPLVENAFKHGVSETRGEPFVDIHLSINHRKLHFTVINSTGLTQPGGVKENIGLSNLRRQLELLYSDFSLLVKQEEYRFSATLQINLASHVTNKMYNN